MINQEIGGFKSVKNEYSSDDFNLFVCCLNCSRRIYFDSPLSRPPYSVMGASSQIIYVLLGVIGLPVFAGFKAGIGILFGPTGGFLLGFIISAYIIGKIVELKKEKNIFYYFLAGIIGTIILYIIGITQLSLVTGIGIKKAITVGLLLFLPGDILKIIAASFIASKLKLVIK